MFADLNMWEEAAEIAPQTSGGNAEILKRKATAQIDALDLTSAATTYEQMGDYLQAIEILGLDYHELLMDLARRIPETEIKALNRCAFYFRKGEKKLYVIETLRKINDNDALLRYLIDMQLWDEAFKISEINPALEQSLFLAYGHWLASNDRFLEAQLYYAKSGRSEESINVLKQLSSRSISQLCYKDAAYYIYCLSNELSSKLPANVLTQEFDEMQLSTYQTSQDLSKLGEVYFAYDKIYVYIEDPFTFEVPVHLMSTCFFLISRLKTYKETPRSISMIYIYYTLAKISKILECYKVCKYALKLLGSLHIPFKWRESIDLLALIMKAKPDNDSAALYIKCIQCGHSNSPENSSCSYCYEPYVYSLMSFEPLGLLRFGPTPDCSISDAKNLIQFSGKSEKEVMNFEVIVADRFHNGYKPLEFNKSQLASIDPHSVFTKKIPGGFNFYFNTGNSLISQCDSCQNFFGEDEWNYHLITEQKCPFCRSKYI